MVDNKTLAFWHLSYNALIRLIKDYSSLFCHNPPLPICIKIGWEQIKDWMIILDQ